MKLKTFLIFVLVLFMSNLLVIRCDLFKDKNTQCFSGRVVDSKGNPVQGALISIGGQQGRNIETSKSGEFKICAKPNEHQRYVINVEKIGFGLASKVFTEGANNIEVTMTSATVVEIDPSTDFIVVDTVAEVTPPASALIGSVLNPLDTIPFVFDSKGQLIAFGAPPAIADTYDAIEEFTEPVSGAMIQVEGNSLEEASAQASIFQPSMEQRKITASLSTIDIYARDGMPGDYSTRLADGSLGYMETYGAADVNFYRNGKKLQLKKGKYAVLTIPLNSIAIAYYGESLPERIPLLVYNQNTGEWRQDVDRWTNAPVFGLFDTKRKAYVAKVSHFSVFNMDEEFANPSCTRLCNVSSGAENIPVSAEIEVSVGSHINRYPFSSPCATGCGAGKNAFGIARMKQKAPIGVRIFDGPPPGGNVKYSFVFFGGAPSTDIYNDNCTTINNLASCSTEITLKWSPCYASTSTIGATNGPVLAVNRGNDLNNDGLISNDSSVDRNGDAVVNILDNEFNYFALQWIYIDNVAGGVPANSTARQFRIQYQTYDDTDNYDGFASPSDVDFNTLAGTNNLYPPAVSTDWRFPAPALPPTSLPVAFVGASGTIDSNEVISASKIIVFRVDSTTDGSTFTNGSVYHVWNMPTSGTFYNDFTSPALGGPSCYTPLR